MGVVTLEYSAVLQPVVSSVSVGDVLTKSTDGVTWVVANSTNFTSALNQVWAICLDTGSSANPVPIQFVGEVSAR